MSEPPFYGIKKINDNVWSINESRLLHLNSAAAGPLWTEANGHSFAITELPQDYERTLEAIPTDQQEIEPDSSPEIVRSFNFEDGRFQTFALGSQALIKIQDRRPLFAKEQDILRAVQGRFSFRTPEVILAWEDEHYNYLVLRRIPGRTLKIAWPELEAEEQIHYSRWLLRCHREMATWKSPDGLNCGIDGKCFREGFLNTFEDRDTEQDLWSHELFSGSCRAIGMDCSDIVFQHNNAQLENVIVTDEFSYDDAPVLINWLRAGFAPRDWIWTKIVLDQPEDWMYKVYTSFLIRLDEDFDQHARAFALWDLQRQKRWASEHGGEENLYELNDAEAIEELDDVDWLKGVGEYGGDGWASLQWSRELFALIESLPDRTVSLEAQQET